MLRLSNLDLTIAYSVIRSAADRTVELIHGEDIARFWETSERVQKFWMFSVCPHSPGYEQVQVSDDKFILLRPVPGVEVKKTVVETSIAVFGNVLDFTPLIEWLSAM